VQPGRVLFFSCSRAEQLIESDNIPGRDQDYMIHQLRVNEIFPHNMAAFHTRFRDHALRIMRRYGFDILAMWEAQGQQRTEFVYLLAWPDEATKQDAWTKFMADAEWKEIKRVTREKHGDLIGSIEDRALHLVDYSPQMRRMTTDGNERIDMERGVL
jgi:hypothetical protein